MSEPDEYGSWYHFLAVPSADDKTWHTEIINDWLNVDYLADGRVLGLEILGGHTLNDAIVALIEAGE